MKDKINSIMPDKSIITLINRFIPRLSIVTLLSIFLIFVNLQAQEEEIQFKHLTAEDGLSINSVSNIIQDSRGFLWFGTNSGINRYDGYHFKIFTHDQSDPNSISNNNINFFCEDNNGYIWIGTQNGLNKYDWKTEKFFRYKNDPKNTNSLSSNLVYTVFKDKSGNIWVGTANGVNRYNVDKDNFTVIKMVSNRLNPDSSNSVTNIEEDHNGNLWLGTWNGLAIMQKDGRVIKQFFAWPANAKKFEYRVASKIFEDKSKNLWIGTNGNGLKRYNYKTGKFTDYLSVPENPSTLSNGYISAIFQDNLNNLWIGTQSGLNKYNPGKDNFTRFFNNPQNSSSIISNGIYSITQDNSGLIWIGTSAGISRFFQSRSQFSFLTENFQDPDKGLISGRIISLCIDKKDDIWVGTMDGLNKIQSGNGKITHFRHQAGNKKTISSNFIRSVYVDHEGFVWIGTNNDGLNRYNPLTGDFKIFAHAINDPFSISNMGVTAICEDRNGILWFGTWWGLNRYDKKTGKFINYHFNPANPNSLADDFVWDIYIDSQEMVWIATERGGVSLLNPKTNTFTNFSSESTNKNYISDNKVITIFESSDSVMWFGTSFGLNSYNRTTGKIKIYHMKDGLPGDVINGIQEDKKGFLWIGTDRGLSKFDRKAETFNNYNKRDGLRNLEFLPRVAAKSKEGILYFGSYGLMHFNPDSLKDEFLTAPVAFTDLKIYNQSVPVTKDGILNQSITASKEIYIPHGHDVITIDFALLDFFDTKRNTFRYHLEGFDVGWNAIGNRNTATYTNLAPGEYTFIVRASNNSSVKNEKEASIKIILVPAFYQTWWFKIVMGIGIILIAVLIINLRIRKIQKQNKLLEKHVAERTKDLDSTIGELNKEIIERIKAEEKVHASLSEKEVLLKEVHHRVKNNLQMISSMLYLQSVSLEDKEILKMFDDSQNRIRSMALIHEQLYQSKNLSNINFEEYIIGLIKHLHESLDRTNLKINTRIFIKDIDLSLDTSISCGLIINELVTNAYKYAFPAEWVRQNQTISEFYIEIKVEQLDSNKFVLTMKDNGIGIPKDLDIQNTSSLGLKIVTSMVKQLNGSIEISKDNGTQFKIFFAEITK